MLVQDNSARDLLEVYRSQVRDFLAEHEVPNLDALDRAAELLERALAVNGDLKVGFLGEAQVGKSTLINALLDRQALPAGGIGPLTAQATRVTFSNENALVAKYHGKGQLNRLTFGIARFLEIRGDLKRGTAEADAPSDPIGDDDNVAIATMSEPAAAGAAEDHEKFEIGRYMLDQAKRILHFANADALQDDPSDVALLDGIRAIIGQKALGDAGLLEPYRRRIEEVQRILAQTEQLSESTEGGVPGFNRALKQRAAGWMSPMVEELQLHLKSSALRGLSLVDLPGIGVIADPAGKEAERFVRTEGDALVVVFRNSGMTESIASLLERTGVITKLLFGGKDDLPPIHVVLAVTHLDNVALTRFRQLAQEAQENGERAPNREDIYRTAAVEMEAKIRSMVGDTLRASKAFEDLPEDQRRARETVIDRLCESMQIFCVASPDYLAAKTGMDDGMGFLRDPESTQVPDLRRHLLSLARDVDNRRRQTVSQYQRALRTSICDHLTAIAQMYEEGRGVAIKEFERFRDAIVVAAVPLREEMKAYHGEALGVLRKAMQSEIKMVCKDAQMAGMRKLRRVSKDAREKHFMAVKAAFNRDGVWDHRGINYPLAITSAMVDSIATDWEPKIIERVREEVRALADRDLKLVERLCEAAREANERILAETPIDSQKKILQANSRSAVAWTKDQLEDLRASVATSLKGAVEKPIKKVCAAARKQLVHQGPGARNRIVDTFTDAGEEAIEEASQQAEQSLKEHYNKLLRNLNDGFLKENHDPIQAAVDALTGEQITKARKSDAQRKRKVTARVSEFSALISGSDAGSPCLPEAAAWHSATVSA